MGTRSPDRRLLFDRREKLHQFRSLLGNGPGITKTDRAPRGAFDAKHTDICEIGCADLLCEILGTMKISGCEIGGIVGRIAMLPGRKIGRDDVPESGVFEISSIESIGQRCKAGNRCGKDDASRPENPMGFAQRPNAICMLYEVIERA
ncbi:MAG TPA: hypothetical protein VMT64_14095, partial [Candidatus Binataceae bacterium]|nr:hypothetical protein [Candidatus Binataceae bacterium]